MLATISLFIHFSWLDFIDILLVTVLLYNLYYLVRGTPALSIFFGMLVFYLIYRTVRYLEMDLLSNILGKFIDLGVIALVIVFQQELRRFFLFLGTSDIFKKGRFARMIDFKWDVRSAEKSDFGAIARACNFMSEAKTGAILVLTKDSDLKFYAETGDVIEAKVTARMIESIFYKNSPLHDGAVIITGNTIKAARCVLPVTDDPGFPAHLGMRHRAAVGITENTDAIAIVVSEQTGAIAMAKAGHLQHGLASEQLKEKLEKEFQ